MKPVDKVTDFKNVHGKQPNKAIAVKRLDHLNILAGDIRSQRDFCVDTLGYRLYERIELDDGSAAGGSWMSVTIAAHELIYTKDAYAAQGAHGRLHHVAFWVDTREECLRAADIWIENDVFIEFAPSKHNVAQGFFLYGYEPGGNRIEITSGGRLVYAPGRAVRGLDRGRPQEGPGLAQRDRPHLPHLRDAAGRGGRAVAH